MARRQIGTIQEVCAGYFGITVPDILGKARAGDLPKFRAVAMYLARELTTASYPDLALTFGGRDHTTVLSTITNIARQIEADPALARVVRELSALAAPQEEESIAA
jgi:chromosomal replication initiator protein